MKKVFSVVVFLCAIYFVNGAPEVISHHKVNTFVTTEVPIGPTHPMDNPDWIPPTGPTHEKSKEHWNNLAQDLLRNKVEKKINERKAKNIILFIGDGLSLPTQMAARVYLNGESSELSFEKFPYTGLAKTYCVNYQVPDSACTATAFLSGIKNNYGTLGVTAKVPLRNCEAQQDETTHVNSIFKWAQDKEKSTGIVTNARLTHATPAAAYATSADREWENDSLSPEGCDDIAKQLVHGDVGKKIKVLLGGGARELLPNTYVDSVGRSGFRTDNRNLINEWLTERQSEGNAGYVNDKNQLLQINEKEIDFLLGTFGHSHMNYRLDANPDVEPSLAEMALTALKILEKNSNGYFLLIEGGRIDHAHHATLAKLALDETVEFHKAVEAITNQVNLEDTLIVVTADHSHTMSVGGYPIRGNNILSKGDFSREDSMPFFTLNYANGMGFFNHFKNTGGRIDPNGMNYMDNDFLFPATVPLDYETHGGDDVAVFSIGPWSHLFTGLYEQNYIAHALMYASCLGDGMKADICNGSNSIKPVILTSLFLSCIILLKEIRIL